MRSFERRAAVELSGRPATPISPLHSLAATTSSPLFAQPPDGPAVSEPAPSPQWAAAVDRARPMVRAAIVDQNLPGVSIAVGMGVGIVWAEGFGWRDVVTHTPVTP